MANTADITLLLRRLCTPSGVAFAVQPIDEPSANRCVNDDITQHLSIMELGVLSTIRSDRRRAEFCAGRLAAKQAVAGQPFGIPERLIEIGRSAAGAPLLRLKSSPDESPTKGGLPFISITHTSRFAVAVAANRPIGVDLELEQSRPDALIRYFFSEREAVIVRALDPVRRTVAINQLWSRKEAACKVRGWGSTLKFRELDCTRDLICINGTPIRLSSSSHPGFAATVACELQE
jgi:phosphopantetheinyl transferase